MVNQDISNIIISPVGFTSDHLETIYEIDQFLIPELNSQAKAKGKLILRARSLNDHPSFINCLSAIIQEAIEKNLKGRRTRCIDCKFEECNIVNTHQL